MNNFLYVIWDCIKSAFITVIEFLKNNLRTFAMILEIVAPYIMYFIGQRLATDRGMIAVGGEIFIPLIISIVIGLLRGSANRIGKGITTPIPNKRFTTVSEDGEVSIDNDRIQEVILYLADLEDWLERKGLL